MPEAEKSLCVEVAYALPDQQVLIPLGVEAGTTLEQAIIRSGVLEQFPAIDLAHSAVGVWGKAAKLDTPLRDGDRVEIYRPLIADPKEVRKQRARQGKVMRRGAGTAEGE